MRLLVDLGLPMICQKPLANDFATAREIISVAQSSKALVMIHDDFRFQPWYREIKRLLDQGVIGHRLHTITMRTRMGDGWGDEAYLSRQPYFRTMPRLLVHETGVHFVDTFRYLAGEIVQCSADLRRFNHVISGEDAGHVFFQHSSGATTFWDANRYNESLADNPRYTFGELLVEADEGSIWLGWDGAITIKRLGQPPIPHPYAPSKLGFAGDCTRACQQHFLDVLDGKSACETSPTEYLKSLRVVEAVYQSSQSQRRVTIGFENGARASEASCGRGTRSESTGPGPGLESGPEVSSLDASPRTCPQRRIVDLTLPVTSDMRGVEMSPAKMLSTDGWNATTLTMYSHAGTHMDAPKHFLLEGVSLDQQDLSVCCGPARLVNLVPIAPRQLIGVDDIVAAIGQVNPGDRLLFRTDWHKRFGSSAYRDELPRISIELARWLAQKRVALIGVEPPSVADVNAKSELTEVHQTLFRAGIVIVEGLANLDELTQAEFEFIALPLKLIGGDGSPVRAIAIEQHEVPR